VASYYQGEQSIFSKLLLARNSCSQQSMDVSQALRKVQEGFVSVAHRWPGVGQGINRNETNTAQMHSFNWNLLYHTWYSSTFFSPAAKNGLNASMYFKKLSLRTVNTK